MRWEHLYLQIVGATVIQVNGQKVGEYNLPGQTKGPVVWDYINQMGQQGWQVVGMTDPAWGLHGYDFKSNAANWHPFIIIMKRPLPA